MKARAIVAANRKVVPKPSPHNSHTHSAWSKQRDAAMQVLKKLRQTLALRKSRSLYTHCAVSASQLWTMRELEKQPGIKVTELAIVMGLHQSTVSNLLHKLAKRQLIRRKRGTVDARTSHLYLTAAGERVLGRTAPKTHKTVLDTLQGLPSHTLRSLDRVLTALVRCMEP